jgi:RNA polymerase sigma-70 factor, ECF subfamily
MGAEVAYAEDRFRRRGLGLDAPSERQRFEQILARHHRRLRRAAGGILVDRDRVDDVLQDAYLKAYRKLPRRFESVEHEAAWLYKVVYRTALDELRRRRRRPEIVALEDVPALSSRDEPSELLAIEDAFRTLPVADRALLMLVGVLRLDQETAARILGIPRSTLARRLGILRTQFEVTDA